MNEDYKDNNRSDNDYRRDDDYYELDYNTNDNRSITINTGSLEKTVIWSGIFGIITIISGVLTCLGAIGTFGISLIPGIISIFLGVKLNNVKKAIDSYLRGDSNAINDTFEHLGNYFKIQGILTIVTLVIGVLF